MFISQIVQKFDYVVGDALNWDDYLTPPSALLIEWEMRTVIESTNSDRKILPICHLTLGWVRYAELFFFIPKICRTWFPSLSQLNSYSLLISNIITYVYLSNYTTVKVSNLKPTPLSFHSLVFPDLSLFYRTPKYYYRLIVLLFSLKFFFKKKTYSIAYSKSYTSIEVLKK